MTAQRKRTPSGQFREDDYWANPLVDERAAKEASSLAGQIESAIKNAVWEHHLLWCDFIHGTGGEPQMEEPS